MIIAFLCHISLCRGYGSNRVPGRCWVTRCPCATFCQRRRWWQEKVAGGGSGCAPGHCWDHKTLCQHHHHQRSRWATWDYKDLQLWIPLYIYTGLCVIPSSFPASSIFSFLQPAYTSSRQDGVVNIPVGREIIEDGRTQVTYRTRDLTAKDKLVSTLVILPWPCLLGLVSCMAYWLQLFHEDHF